MRYRKSTLISLPALLFAGTILSADSVTVTLTGAGPVNDGTDYVLPYELSIDGLAVSADCYDFFDEVQQGQAWQANELTLAEAASYGQFSGLNNAIVDYEDVAWLSSQATPTQQSQIDLQHVIWNVFDPGQFAITPGMAYYLTSLALAQPYFVSDNNDNFANFDNYTFIEAIPSPDSSLPQAFVIQSGSAGGGGQSGGSATPEPDATFLLAVGLGMITFSRLCGWRRKSAPTKRRYVLHPVNAGV
jgi:hypothetical protein